jgi:hypothetical protein
MLKYIQSRNYLIAPFTEWMFGTDIMQGTKLAIHIHLVLQIMKKWDIICIMLNEHMESFIIATFENGIIMPYQIFILIFLILYVYNVIQYSISV